MEAEKQNRKRARTVLSLLCALEKEAIRKSRYDLFGEGVFMSVLRANFAKAFEYARYSNRIDPRKADEGCYFLASALRGICEELIALIFIRQLPADERDEVIAIEMARGVRKAVEAQTRFFEAVRPFQPIIKFRSQHELVAKEKNRIDEIARTSGVWPPHKGKLPPIKQMSDKIGLQPIYDYFYRITSDVVHFNPRIALRSGWGEDPAKGRFSTANFARYYLFHDQIYGVFLFSQFCHAFKQDLGLSKSFLKKLDVIDVQLAEILRWPEAVTFEEANKPEPSWWLRAALKFAHEQGWDNKTTAQMLPEMEQAAEEADLLEQGK